MLIVYFVSFFILTGKYHVELDSAVKITLLLVPTGVVTLTSPVVVPLGTVQVIFPPLHDEYWVAFIPSLKVT